MMSVSRVAFVDSTNTSRPSPSLRVGFSRLSTKLSSRKSPPTCTISLANVNANDLCMNVPSAPYSLPATPVTSIIPFPSSSDSPISKSDSSCLLLLRCSPEGLALPRTRASSVQLSQERRKRSTARLASCQKGSETELHPQLSQPPRKKPRLQKGSKCASRASSSSPELRFTALVQRSVASGVIAQKARGRSRSPERSERTASFETQDWLLACHLRKRLLEQGVKDIVIDVGCDPAGTGIAMEVDAEPGDLPMNSFNMDIDVEPRATFVLSSPPHPSRARTPSADQILSAPKLVAALIMRHRYRTPSKLCRSEWKAKRSPLGIPEPSMIPTSSS